MLKTRYSYKLALLYLLLIGLCLACFPDGTMAQEAPRDFEKRMMEESGNLFSFLTQFYDKPAVNTDYMLTRLKDDGHQLLESSSDSTFELRNPSFYKAFERNQTVTLSDSFVEVSVEAQNSPLFQYWESQILWRLSQYGIQTASVLSLNNEQHKMVNGYRSIHKDSRHLVEISQKVDGEENILIAGFTQLDNMVIDYRSEKSWGWGREADENFLRFYNVQTPSIQWLEDEWQIIFGSIAGGQLDEEKLHLILSREQDTFYLAVNNFSTGEHFGLMQEDESIFRFYIEKIRLEGQTIESFQKCLKNEPSSICTIEGSNLKIPISTQTLIGFFRASELDISVLLPAGKSLLHLIPLAQYWKPSEKEIQLMMKDLNINEN